MKRYLSGVFAFAGAANCVFVPLLFVANLQQPLFPQPGLYFAEITASGLLGFASIVRQRATWLPWFLTGVLLVFNVLGAWSIGLWLLPATLCILGAGLLVESTMSTFQKMGYLGVGLLAQGVLMQAWIVLDGI